LCTIFHWLFRANVDAGIWTSLMFPCIRGDRLAGTAEVITPERCIHDQYEASAQRAKEIGASVQSGMVEDILGGLNSPESITDELA
jgi:hypothetical protein